MFFGLIPKHIIFLCYNDTSDWVQRHKAVEEIAHLGTARKGALDALNPYVSSFVSFVTRLTKLPHPGVIMEALRMLLRVTEHYSNLHIRTDLLGVMAAIVEKLGHDNVEVRLMTHRALRNIDC